MRDQLAGGGEVGAGAGQRARVRIGEAEPVELLAPPLTDSNTFVPNLPKVLGLGFLASHSGNYVPR